MKSTKVNLILSLSLCVFFFASAFTGTEGYNKHDTKKSTKTDSEINSQKITSSVEISGPAVVDHGVTETWFAHPNGECSTNPDISPRNFFLSKAKVKWQRKRT